MLNLGNVPAGATVYIPFTSYDSNGASVTLTGLAVTDIEIYKDGSVTQRASDAGYTLLDTDGIDFDGITGIHGFSVNLADNTDAGFYAVGSFYWVVVSAVTIDTRTVNFVAATFRICPAESITATPKVDVAGWLGTAPATPGTAGVPSVDAVRISTSATAADNLETAALAYSATRGLAGTALPNAAADAAGGLPISDAGGLDLDARLDAAVSSRLAPTVAARTLDVSAGGEAGIDWANIGSPTTAQNLSGTNIDVDQVVASVSGAVGSVTGNVGGNVAGSVGSVTGAVGSVTGNVGGNVTGSVGSVTGNVGGNVTGSVGSIATGGITTASFAAGAIDNAAIATDAIGAAELAASAVAEIQLGLSTLTQADIRTAVGLASANLDTQLDALPTAAENATALLDLSAGIETGLTPRQALRLIAAAVAGKLSGAATTTITIRNAVADTDDRIVATVDSSGNRSAITYDLT